MEECSPFSIFILKRFNIAVPEAYASRQPFLPQLHGKPSFSTRVCPNSPAVKNFPLYNFPSITKPQPTPVPTVMQTMSLHPFPAPKRNSPKAAASVSWPMYIGMENISEKSFLTGTSFQPRLGASKTLPLFLSTVPGTPIPIDSTLVPGSSE